MWNVARASVVDGHSALAPGSRWLLVTCSGTRESALPARCDQLAIFQPPLAAEDRSSLRVSLAPLPLR